MAYDVFISYASEDREEVARPLARELELRGLDVWFDESRMTIGDSVRGSIDRGLIESDFGVVILSPSFLRKDWTNRELSALVALERHTDKVVLPVWHHLSRDHIARYSPTLADKVAVSTNLGIKRVADEIVRAMKAGGAAVIDAPPAADVITESRRILLTSSDRHELTRCLYELKRYLSTDPHNVEAQLLLDNVEKALAYAASHPVPPASDAYSRRSHSRRSPVTAMLLVAFVAALGIYLAAVRGRPIEVVASSGGDRYTARLGTNDLLQFSVTSADTSEIDLSVMPPEGPTIGPETPSGSPDAAVDRSVPREPGTKTITIRRPGSGTYRVLVHNRGGQRSVKYRLSVLVKGRARRVFIGELQPGRRYSLDVSVAR